MEKEDDPFPNTFEEYLQGLLAGFAAKPKPGGDDLVQLVRSQVPDDLFTPPQTKEEEGEEEGGYGF